jgi:hemerythrin
MPTAVNILEWTPEYTVRVPEIDREHQVLFGVVNGLYEAMLNGKGRTSWGRFSTK